MNKISIVAELSANHNKDLKLALKSMEAIKKSGASAIKIQTYKPSCLTLKSKEEIFKLKGGLWGGQYLWDLYKKASMPWEWHNILFQKARDLDLEIFSSPFSLEGLELLESLNCPYYKIASFEIAHVELIKACAATKKPIIASLGIACFEEIINLLRICKDNEVTLLHCTSAYPSTLKDSNLNTIKHIKDQYKRYHKNLKVGLSDHTKGISTSLIAACLGASLIEKHFILDKKIKTPDSEFSLDAKDFKKMVKKIKRINKALGIPLKAKRLKKEDKALIKGRELARSLYVIKDLKKGSILKLEDIKIMRPNAGLNPLYLDHIIGKKLCTDVAKNSPLLKSHIDSNLKKL